MGESNLDPIGIAEAVQAYLDQKRAEVSQKTLHNHSYRLEKFVDFCEENDIETTISLTGRDIHRYRVELGEGVKPVTLRNHLVTVRQFLQFCVTIDAVEETMPERVILPELSREEEAKDVKLEEERAEEILSHLDRFAYASRDHVIFLLLWHGGIRLGTLRAFDLEDFEPEELAIRIRHRPPDTPLKNKERAERSIAISERVAQVVADYVKHTRESVEDGGRKPLITTKQGRVSESLVRTTCYRLTVPCMIGPCPHDRDPDTCDYLDGSHSQCPSSRSPHALRRGRLTAFLREGSPTDVVSERCNVSKDVLDQHYDRRTEREKREVRRDYLDNL
jgi:site-specific recombinase XerD